MLKDNRHSDLFLLTHEEVENNASSLATEQIEPMQTMLGWARTYLFKGDKKLGRTGPVCPFVRPGIEQHRSLYFTSLDSPLLDIESTKRQLECYRDWFLELRPTGRIKRNFKAILALLPGLSGHPQQTEIIEAIHRPPKDTRAFFRGECLRRYPEEVFGVNWDSISFGVDDEPVKRIMMTEPLKGSSRHVGELLERSSNATELVKNLSV